ncbi:MAG: dehydrogenase [Clostridia bacterium]
MEIRSRAPLRLGFAGGGTDLLSYSDFYGGAVFNATINMYAHCTIIPTDNNIIKIVAYDNQNNIEIESKSFLPIEDEKLILHKGVYNRIVKDFNNNKPLSFEMYTSNDAPSGSGLGTSSTMVVAILEAFCKWLKIDLSNYEKAQLAYDIERNDLNLKGGKQDQYCAVFGGFNFMEFLQNGSVVINSLRLNKDIINELESSLILYYNGRSRSSSKIISEQIKNTSNKNVQTIDAMHLIKQSSLEMKNAIIYGSFNDFSNILKTAWENKKKTSNSITNPEIERVVDYVNANGAKAVKISGAGGGGFMMININPINRQKMLDALKTLAGQTFPVGFTDVGVESWII